MKKLILLVVGLLCVSVTVLAGEVITNDTGEDVTGLRVVFSTPVLITTFGDILTNVDEEGLSYEFVFSGGTVPPWGSHWFNYAPTTASVMETKWLTGSTASEVPLSEQYWQIPYTSSSDFILGGWMTDYLVEREWRGYWQDVHPMDVLVEHGFAWIKVAVTTNSVPEFESPSSTWPSIGWSDAAWQCRENAALKIEEAQARGLKTCLLLMMSDQAAHAGQQPCPAMWIGLTIDQLKAEYERYTYETIRYMQSRGIHLDMVEVGGEIEPGLPCWHYGTDIPEPNGIASIADEIEYMMKHVWPTEAELLKSALRGVQRAAPGVLTTTHVNSMCASPLYAIGFFSVLAEHGVELDYAGVSLPYPHKPGLRTESMTKKEWFDELAQTMTAIYESGYEVLIGEFAYPYRATGVPGSPMFGYPFTVEGQAEYIRDTLRFASNHPHVAGTFYWNPNSFPGSHQAETEGQLFHESFGLFSRNGIPNEAMREFLGE
jgi:arabinogalactan endo-1,4-beta-galactosidase